MKKILFIILLIFSFINIYGKTNYLDFPCSCCHPKIFEREKGDLIIPLVEEKDTIIYLVGHSTNWGEITRIHYVTKDLFKTFNPFDNIDSLEYKVYRSTGMFSLEEIYKNAKKNDSIVSNIFHDARINNLSVKNKVNLLNNVLENINRNKCPYGYYDYRWTQSSFGGIGITFRYHNSNKKVIKYIIFYYGLLNDVKDPCPIYMGSNKGKCVGPLYTGEDGEWEWESLGYSTNDANQMYIKRIELIYMDNSKKILIKEMKRF